MLIEFLLKMNLDLFYNAKVYPINDNNLFGINSILLINENSYTGIIVIPAH